LVESLLSSSKLHGECKTQGSQPWRLKTPFFSPKISKGTFKSEIPDLGMDFAFYTCVAAAEFT